MNLNLDCPAKFSRCTISSYKSGPNRRSKLRLRLRSKSGRTRFLRTFWSDSWKSPSGKKLDCRLSRSSQRDSPHPLKSTATRSLRYQARKKWRNSPFLTKLHPRQKNSIAKVGNQSLKQPRLLVIVNSSKRLDFPIMPFNPFRINPDGLRSKE